MNYLPFCGYWFVGAATSTERAAFFCSWGLLSVAPLAAGAIVGGLVFMSKLFGFVVR